MDLAKSVAPVCVNIRRALLLCRSNRQRIPLAGGRGFVAGRTFNRPALWAKSDS
jgi:hypothetical protein